MPTSTVYALWAFAAGAAIPVMAILNAGLGRGLGGPPLAAVVLFAVGLLATCLAALALRARLPGLAEVAAIPPHLFAGGLIVAFYVVSVTTLAPLFGVGNTILFAVSAQICSSAAIDAWGLFGVTPRPLGATRLVGLAILLAGLAIAQLGAARPKG